MYPLFNSWGDFCLAERASWILFRQIRVGDVIVFVSPINPTGWVCKVVVGLPGDIVSLESTLEEPTSFIVGKGKIWVEGVFRENSMDSRDYGEFPMGLVRGKVWLKVWPQFGLLSSMLHRIKHDRE